jgi:ADP-ribosylglycohydrolase
MSDDRGGRAAGSFTGLAYGDALGVPYEYGSLPLPVPPERARMLGGGLGDFAPGEWSDDTQMAVCVARALQRADPGTPAGLVAIADEFEFWAASHPPDMGIQTARVLRDAALLRGDAATRLGSAARALHEKTGHTAGNGALMRTAPIAYRLLGDAAAIAFAARSVAELTHPDPLAGDCCVLWCLAIDAAIRGDSDSPAEFVGELPIARRDQWAGWIADAGAQPPAAFADNGFTVTALQAAWSAIYRTDGFEAAMDAAISAGGDTDTVAAVAGALAGARYGIGAIRDHQLERVHGWPGLTAADLADLARALIPAAA